MNKQLNDYLAESGIVLTSLAIAFMTAGSATLANPKAGLLPIWSIPAVLVIALDRINTGRQPRWVLQALERVSRGAWMGYSLRSVFFLNDWYLFPADAHTEPLVTSLALCTAGLVALHEKFEAALETAT